MHTLNVSHTDYSYPFYLFGTNAQAIVNVFTEERIHKSGVEQIRRDRHNSLVAKKISRDVRLTASYYVVSEGREFNKY